MKFKRLCLLAGIFCNSTIFAMHPVQKIAAMTAIGCIAYPFGKYIAERNAEILKSQDEKNKATQKLITALKTLPNTSEEMARQNFDSIRAVISAHPNINLEVRAPLYHLSKKPNETEGSIEIESDTIKASLEALHRMHELFGSEESVACIRGYIKTNHEGLAPGLGYYNYNTQDKKFLCFGSIQIPQKKIFASSKKDDQ